MSHQTTRGSAVRIASIGGMKEECAGCGEFISGTRYHSSLYLSSHHLLCKSCHNYEESQIEEKGTNDIPLLLAVYNQKKFSHQEE